MFGRFSVRWAVPVAAAALVAPVALVGASAAAGPPVQRVQQAAGTVVDSFPCQGTVGCEPVFGAGVGMAVPLIRPWLHGTDGNWYIRPDHVELNQGDAGRLSGTLNDKAAVVVPAGVSLQNYEQSYSVIGFGSATVIFNVSGSSYRRAVLKSTVSRSADLTVQPAQTRWEVDSDLYAFACTQRGSTRNPLVDCGNGTHQFTRGSAQLPTADWQTAYTVTLPINYYARAVDIHGRPLGTPYRTSTGHWTLNAQPQYHGWLWTVDWDITGVAAARATGSVFASGLRQIFTDGPFN